MENQFLRPNGIENVSNMSQSVWNIIIDDQKHILDLKKSYKGRLNLFGTERPFKVNWRKNVLFQSTLAIGIDRSLRSYQEVPWMFHQVSNILRE